MSAFTYRQAEQEDIQQLQIVRRAVLENKLSDPSIIPDAAYIPFLEKSGRGWVCLQEKEVVGFAFVDFVNHNIWALFVKPEFENKGVGKTLHNLMLDWYFRNYEKPLWLSTAPNTRAEKFYELQGWNKAGVTQNNETRFEITRHTWESLKR